MAKRLATVISMIVILSCCFVGSMYLTLRGRAVMCIQSVGSSDCVSTEAVFMGAAGDRGPPCSGAEGDALHPGHLPHGGALPGVRAGLRREHPARSPHGCHLSPVALHKHVINQEITEPWTPLEISYVLREHQGLRSLGCGGLPARSSRS